MQRGERAVEFRTPTRARFDVDGDRMTGARPDEVDLGAGRGPVVTQVPTSVGVGYLRAQLVEDERFEQHAALGGVQGLAKSLGQRPHYPGLAGRWSCSCPGDRAAGTNEREEPTDVYT